MNLAPTLLFPLFVLNLLYVPMASAQHTFPKTLAKEAKMALSFYPELAHTRIHIKLKKNIRRSTMQARPTFWSLFVPKTNRTYLILISKKFQISDTTFTTKDLESDILVGWLGHELGHIMDYKNRSSLDLLWFGIKYIFSGRYIKEVEKAADTYAIKANMERYILKTKRFILNNADISKRYKQKIRRYYLSPDEILSLVEQREDDQ
jgi:hypothetical protein